MNAIRASEAAPPPAGDPPPERSPLRGRSILLLHDDPFVGSYIRAVLAGADAVVLGPASIGEGRELLSAGTGIDAAVLDFDMSGADSHGLADEFARQELAYLFVVGRSCFSGRLLLRGRLGLSWPYAGFEVCEALAGMLISAPPAIPERQERIT